MLAHARRANAGLPTVNDDRAWPRFPAELWRQVSAWLAATPAEQAERDDADVRHPFWDGYWPPGDTLAHLRRIHDIVAAVTRG